MEEIASRKMLWRETLTPCSLSLPCLPTAGLPSTSRPSQCLRQPITREVPRQSSHGGPSSSSTTTAGSERFAGITFSNLCASSSRSAVWPSASVAQCLLPGRASLAHELLAAAPLCACLFWSRAAACCLEREKEKKRREWMVFEFLSGPACDVLYSPDTSLHAGGLFVLLGRTDLDSRYHL